MPSKNGVSVTEADPKDLKNHPLNQSIYADAPDEDFIASVRAFGVLSPLTILDDGTVISGHKRMQAARILKLKTVPVITRGGLAEDIDVRELLIHSNRGRERTKEVRAREYSALTEIAAERAARRQPVANFRPQKTKPSDEKPEDSESAQIFAHWEKDGRKREIHEIYTFADVDMCENATAPAESGDPPQKSGKPGRAADAAAAKVGMSRPTAEKAVEVVRQIDSAREAGDDAKAEELREALNTKGVAKAHRLAMGQPAKARAAPAVLDADDRVVPRRLHEVFASREVYKRLLFDVRNIKKRINDLALTPSGVRIMMSTVIKDLDNVRRMLRFSQPHARCPYCDWTGKKESAECRACDGLGWVGETTYHEAPNDLKESQP